MIEVRTTTVDKIMQTFQLGKYANENADIIESLQVDLRQMLKKEEVMQILAGGAINGAVGVHQYGDYRKVNDLIEKLIKLTGKSPEEIFIAAMPS